MQGLWKWAVAGTQEQIELLFAKSADNVLLSNLFIERNGDKLKIFQDISHVEVFEDRFKYVCNSGNSGNVTNVSEITDCISELVPELEVILLIEAFSDDGDEMREVMYYPSGCISAASEDGDCIYQSPMEGEPSYEIDDIKEYIKANNLTEDEELGEYYFSCMECNSFDEILWIAEFDAELFGLDAVEEKWICSSGNIPDVAYLKKLFGAL